MFLARSISWWYWLATVALLAAALAGLPGALPAVLALGVVQALHFWALEGSLGAFPVQVRLAFLALLLAGLWEPLCVLHWIQLAGTTVFVLTGYCLLARMLSLLPWNRAQPLSLALARETFLAPPTCGNVRQGLPPIGAAASPPGRPVGGGTPVDGPRRAGGPAGAEARR
jgi:hypothetical protein